MVCSVEVDEQGVVVRRLGIGLAIVFSCLDGYRPRNELGNRRPSSMQARIGLLHLSSGLRVGVADCKEGRLDVRHPVRGN